MCDSPGPKKFAQRDTRKEEARTKRRLTDQYCVFASPKQLTRRRSTEPILFFIILLLAKYWISVRVFVDKPSQRVTVFHAFTLYYSMRETHPSFFRLVCLRWASCGRMTRVSSSLRPSPPLSSSQPSQTSQPSQPSQPSQTRVAVSPTRRSVVESHNAFVVADRPGLEFYERRVIDSRNE